MDPVSAMDTYLRRRASEAKTEREFFPGVPPGVFAGVGGALAGIAVLLVLVDTHMVDHEGLQALTEKVNGPFLFLAFIVFLLGELQRRGQMFEQRGGRALIVHLRMLSMGWHVFWIVLSLVPNFWMLSVMTSRGLGDDRDLTWIATSIFASGALGALVASAVKKWSWARDGAGRFERTRDAIYQGRRESKRGGTGAPPRGRSNPLQRLERRQRFWRWYGFRWRLDLWCAGAGMGLIGLGLVLYGWPYGYLSPDYLPLLWVSVVGVLVFAAALWSTTQFWWSGEDLATAESVH